jgi:iron-sulfur cluster assembly accessory protein
MSSYDFELTEAAAKKIAAIKADQKLSNDHFLRIMVEGGGCSGFQYKMNMDDQKANDDHIFTTNNESVVIDDISMEYLRDSSLEFEDSLGGAFLKIKNPNASSSCGCGVSFDMKE